MVTRRAVNEERSEGGVKGWAAMRAMQLAKLWMTCFGAAGVPMPLLLLMLLMLLVGWCPAWLPCPCEEG